MKTWFIPAFALSLLLASSAAMAAPPDQNSMTQRDQRKDANPNAGQSKGNMGSDTDTANRHRDVTIKRRLEVHRNVIVKRPIVVHRNVRVNRHVDIREYRRNFNSPRRYHWQVYRQPPGWYAHRWAYGQRLPRAWFARDYWISDFRMFGLISPPYGYVWVRVREDALLVDVDTGEVIRVVYGVFD